MPENRTQSPETNTRSGVKRTVTDGPFAETKELIAGGSARPYLHSIEDESEVEPAAVG